MKAIGYIVKAESKNADCCVVGNELKIYFTQGEQELAIVDREAKVMVPSLGHSAIFTYKEVASYLIKQGWVKEIK